MHDRQSVETDPIDLVESATSTTQNALKAAQSALAAVKAAQDVLDHKDFSHIKFLNMVSQELRSPLASILGYTQLLRDELDAHLSRQHQEFFKSILTNTKLSLAVVNELTAFVKMDETALSLDFDAIPLQPAINSVVDQLLPFAEEKGILLSADLPMKTHYALADERILRQILYNLVAHAVRYTDDGSVTLHVIPAKSTTQDAYSVEIIDTGRGIAEDIVQTGTHLPTRDARMAYFMDQGVGISLAIALEYIRLLQGRLEIKSTEGHGTNVTLTFDRALLAAKEPDNAFSTPKAEHAELAEQPIEDHPLDGGSW